MELRQLKTFTAIAKTGSFSKAADLLGYAQSSVTTHIQALESDLGVKLFDRLRHKACLTNEGNALFSYTDKILKLVDEAKEAVSPSDGPQGTLTIGTCESIATYRLPKILKEYQRLYPKVEIVLKPANCSSLRNSIRQNEVDAGIFFEKPIKDPDFITTMLSGEKMVLLAFPGHKFSHGNFNFPHDLAGECLIITEPGCSLRLSIETILAKHDVMPRSFLEVSGIESIKHLVMHGLGVAVLQYFAVKQDISDNKLIAVSLQEPGLNYCVQFVYHKDKWLSPTLKAFLDVTKNVAGN